MTLRQLNLLLSANRAVRRTLWPLAYVIVIVHELGHLAAYRAVGGQGQPKLAVGRCVDTYGASVQVGLRLHGAVYMPRYTWLTAEQRRTVLLWGPTASLMWALLMAVTIIAGSGLLSAWTDAMTVMCAVWALVAVADAAVNLLDIRYVDGSFSDGAQIVMLRRSGWSPQVAGDGSAAADTVSA